MINIKDTLVKNLIRCSVIDDYNKQDIIDDIDNAIEYEDSTLEYLNMFLCEDTNRHMIALYVEMYRNDSIHSLSDLEDIIRILHNEFTWLPDVFTEDQLGQYFVEDLDFLNVPEHIRPFIDYNELLNYLVCNGLIYEVRSCGCLYKW